MHIYIYKYIFVCYKPVKKLSSFLRKYILLFQEVNYLFRKYDFFVRECDFSKQVHYLLENMIFLSKILFFKES